MDKQQRRQEHFNKAYLGVIAQGEPAINPNSGGCVYLAPNGSKCAVGHLLSEDELNRYGKFQGGVEDLWRQMSHKGDADYDHPFNVDSDFYCDMQNVHDNLMNYSGPDFVSFFRHNMKIFAQRYKLTVPDETATA